MSEILQYVITAVISIVGTGSIGSIFYFKQQKRMKNAEARSAEADAKLKEIEGQSASISNVSATNDEWIRHYNVVVAEKEKIYEDMNKLLEKLDEVNKSKEAAWERYSDCKSECSKKDLVINELNWNRCEVNNCPYRKPPRKYGDLDFPKGAMNPEENPDPNVL